MHTKEDVLSLIDDKIKKCMRKIIFTNGFIFALLFFKLNEALAGCGGPHLSVFLPKLQTGSDTVEFNSGDTIKLAITVGADCGNLSNFVWRRNGEILNNQSQNRFITKEPGYYTVTFDYDADKTTFSVLLVEKKTASIEKVASIQAVHIFPNPAKESLTIRFNELLEKPKIGLYNIQGKEIPLTYLNESKDYVQIDVSNLLSDVYFLKYEDKTQTLTKKIVIY